MRPGLVCRSRWTERDIGCRRFGRCEAKKIDIGIVINTNKFGVHRIDKCVGCVAANDDGLTDTQVGQIRRQICRVIPQALFMFVTIAAVDGQNVVKLRTVERGCQKGLHKFRCVDRFDVRDAQSMPRLVSDDIAEKKRVVAGVCIEAIVGIDNHFAKIGKVVVSQHIAVAIDIVSGQPYVTSHTNLPGVAGGLGYTVVIGFVHEIDTRHVAPAVKNAIQQSEPDLILHNRLAARIVDSIHSRYQVARLARKSAV